MKRKMCFLVGVLAVTGLIAIGCGDDDGGNGNENINNNNNNQNNQEGDTVYQIQDESHPDFIPEDAEVNLQNVLVTAVDNDGDYTGDVWVQEPAGGEFSGVRVYRPQLPTGTELADVTIGDIVNVSGVKVEFGMDDDRSGRTVTQIANGSLEIVAQGEPLEPVTVESPETIMNDPGGEAYEGVLVRVLNVRAEQINQYDDVIFSGGMVVRDNLMDILSAFEVGTCYGEVVGVVDYFYQYALLPRSTGDIEVAQNDSDCPDPSENCVYPDDCGDWECRGYGYCAENTPELCDDGIDNNGTGLTDCEDPSCLYHPDVLAAGTCAAFVETGADQCSDGEDNDENGYIDCEDRGCFLNFDVLRGVCEEQIENTYEQCHDGIDNDGDGYTDCEAFSCQYAGVCEDVESTDEECDDEVDNDDNGHTDCDDWSCQRSMVVTVCEGNVFTCADDIDNDGNGFVDCSDYACRYCNCDEPENSRVVPVCPPCDCP